MSDKKGYRTLLDYKKTPRLTGRGGVLGVFFCAQKLFTLLLLQESCRCVIIVVSNI